MACNKEKDILLNVIDVYKDMSYLWDKCHTDYMNKEKRSEGFRVLLEIYKNFDDNVTVKVLKKKIENMRTLYTKELKKVNASKQTGAGATEVYVPSLWYFDALSFLGRRTESCRTVTDTLEIENLSSSEEDGPRQRSASVASSHLQKKKKRETLLQKQEKILISAQEMLSSKEEEWEVFGKSIGHQMRDLNKRQLAICQKLISDVIFNAKIDRLSEDSYVVCTPSNERKQNSSAFYQRQKENSYNFPIPSSSNSLPSPNEDQSRYHSSPSSYCRAKPSPSPNYVAQTSPSPNYIAQPSSSPSPHMTHAIPHTINVDLAEDSTLDIPECSASDTVNPPPVLIEDTEDMKYFLLFNSRIKRN